MRAQRASNTNDGWQNFKQRSSDGQRSMLSSNLNEGSSWRKTHGPTPQMSRKRRRSSGRYKSLQRRCSRCGCSYFPTASSSPSLSLSTMEWMASSTSTSPSTWLAQSFQRKRTQKVPLHLPTSCLRSYPLLSFFFLSFSRYIFVDMPDKFRYPLVIKPKDNHQRVFLFQTAEEHRKWTEKLWSLILVLKADGSLVHAEKTRLLHMDTARLSTMGMQNLMNLSLANDDMLFSVPTKPLDNEHNSPSPIAIGMRTTQQQTRSVVGDLITTSKHSPRQQRKLVISPRNVAPTVKPSTSPRPAHRVAVPNATIPLPPPLTLPPSGMLEPPSADGAILGRGLPRSNTDVAPHKKMKEVLNKNALKKQKKARRTYH